MTAQRKARPMIEMSGFVTDLKEQDYLDVVGGDGYRRYTVGRLIHKIEHHEDDWDSERAWVLVEKLGMSGKKAANVAFTPAYAAVTFVDGGVINLRAEVPVTFRRFADSVATTDERITQH